jgi:predicted Zn-dependent peptidase
MGTTRRPPLRLAPLFVLLALGTTPAAAASVERHLRNDGATLLTADLRSSDAVHALAVLSLEDGELTGSGAGALLAEALGSSSAARRLRALGCRIAVRVRPGRLEAALDTDGDGAALALALLGNLLTSHLDESGLAAARLAVSQQQAQRSAAELEQDLLAAAAWRTPWARLPLLGTPERRAAVTLAELQTLQRRNLSRGRLTLVVVGPDEGGRLAQLAARCLDLLPVHSAVALPLPSEPPQHAQRQVLVGAALPPSRLLQAWRLPGAADPQAHAAGIALRAILSERLTERLTLVVDQNAGQVLAEDLRVDYAAEPGLPGLLSISLRVRGGSSAAAAAVRSELDELIALGPDPAVWARIRVALRREELAADASPAGLAARLAAGEAAAGEAKLAEVVREALDALTPAAIQTFAAAQLQPGGENRLRLLGADSSGGAGGTGLVFGDVPVREHRLVGVTLLERYLPDGLAVVQATLGGGWHRESATTRGLTQVWCGLLTEGSQDLVGPAWRAALAERGMTLAVVPGSDAIDVRLTCFPADVPRAMELLLGLLRRPALPAAAWDGAMQKVQDAANAEAVIQRLRSSVLGDHPAARPPPGAEAVAGWSRAVVEQWHHEALVAGNLVLSVSGPFNQHALPQAFARVIGSEPEIPPGPSRLVVMPAAAATAAATVHTLAAAAGRPAALGMGWAWPAEDDDEHRAAAAVLLGLLGRGDDDGVLAQTLAESASGAQVRVHVERHRGAGLLALVLTELTDDPDRVRQALERRLRALSTQLLEPGGISEAQLADARRRALAWLHEERRDAAATLAVHARRILAGRRLLDEAAMQGALITVPRATLARVARLLAAEAAVVLVLPASSPAPAPLRPATALPAGDLPSTTALPPES